MGLVNLRPEEISSVIKEQIKNYTAKLETTDVGTVIQVADGIALFMVWRMQCRENFWNSRVKCTVWS